LLSVVTCVNDMFCHTNEGSLASLGAVDGLEAMGLRGVVAFGAEDAKANGWAVHTHLAEVKEESSVPTCVGARPPSGSRAARAARRPPAGRPLHLGSTPARS
jgi:hypothetical protein